MTTSTAAPTIVAAALAAVRRRIAAAEARWGRAPGSVALLAVSKQQPAAAIREAYAAGQHRFGESYVQEALRKMQALRDLACEWHFIGPLQANKSRAVAEHCAWLHSLDRLALARRLSRQRPSGLPPLNVCLQVNLSGEASKSGVAPAAAAELAAAVRALPNLRLRGLMTLPAPSEDFDTQRAAFAALRELFERLAGPGDWDTLSMGMSADLEAAVAEGATIVRIGTAVFGPRHPAGQAAG